MSQPQPFPPHPGPTHPTPTGPPRIPLWTAVDTYLNGLFATGPDPHLPPDLPHPDSPPSGPRPGGVFVLTLVGFGLMFASGVGLIWLKVAMG